MRRPARPVTERGKIREIKGTLVIVVPDRSAACFGCMNQECKTGGGFISAENPLGLSLSAGQTVEVNASGRSIVGQALTALLPPALGFIAGFALTRLLFGSGEAIAAFAGLFLLLVAVVVTYKIRKRKPAGYLYTIARIL